MGHSYNKRVTINKAMLCMYMHKIYALEFILRIIKWYKFNTVFIVLQQQQSQQEDTPVSSRSFKEVCFFFKNLSFNNAV